MPVYEYYCKDCKKQFEALRPMSKADVPIACKHCEGKRTSRVPSVFAAHSGGKVVSGAGGGGGGCASCGGGSCSSCGAH
jgi:putative FmdB family regulatory protein